MAVIKYTTRKDIREAIEDTFGIKQLIRYADYMRGYFKAKASSCNHAADGEDGMVDHCIEAYSLENNGVKAYREEAAKAQQAYDTITEYVKSLSSRIDKIIDRELEEPTVYYYDETQEYEPFDIRSNPYDAYDEMFKYRWKPTMQMDIITSLYKNGMDIPADIEPPF